MYFLFLPSVFAFAVIASITLRDQFRFANSAR